MFCILKSICYMKLNHFILICRTSIKLYYRYLASFLEEWLRGTSSGFYMWKLVCIQVLWSLFHGFKVHFTMQSICLGALGNTTQNFLHFLSRHVLKQFTYYFILWCLSCNEPCIFFFFWGCKVDHLSRAACEWKD